MGQKQTFRAVNCSVCFTSNADIRSCERHVCFGPKADISVKLDKIEIEGFGINRLFAATQRSNADGVRGEGLSIF